MGVKRVLRDKRKYSLVEARLRHVRSATGALSIVSLTNRFLSCVCRGVSSTKQASQTLVPSLSVKSTRRVRSISAPHFP